MATPDQYETAILAIRDAAATLATYGSADVTATSGKRHRVTQHGDHTRVWSDLEAGRPVGLPTPSALPGDSVSVVYANPDEVVVILRCRR